ncbi:NUDIX hydrolase [Saccharibacillus alkalitolerans]|uniref:NUDIX hydrolase n=1 Tax=Saccharibacillus alkalitolerans TaxID=2705290 RepID=A0ABX0F9H7_9BACL|nr:NUDIX hydrolase [Saccharibacillus alkalitolerans]NGZ76978.1 NUDIX hydrolase [Saccharibacillus alkalitolerans]
MGYIMELRKLVGSRPLIMAGACVIAEKDGGILLQKRTDNGCWGLPGGSLEPGESMEQVARRELMEETGLEAGELELLGVFSGEELYYRYPHWDEVYNVIAAYRCADPRGEAAADGEESSELRVFRPDELPEDVNPADRPVLAAYLKTKSAGQTHGPKEPRT